VFEIGNSLREARVRQGLDFSQAEQATKVRAKYLRALEDEQFDVLPAQTFVKGFLRTYADYLGLDGRLYVDEYKSRFSPEEVIEPPLRARRTRVRPTEKHRRFERSVVLLAVVGITIATALIIAAWKFGGGGQLHYANLAPARPPAAHRSRLANLLVAARKGRNSLLEVHAGSATGRLLFHGTLESLERQRFIERRIWMNIGAPDNITMRLNGRKVSVGGATPRVLIITATQIRPAAPGT
jgi:cytoskeleton protein RodZ